MGVEGLHAADKILYLDHYCPLKIWWKPDEVIKFGPNDYGNCSLQHGSGIIIQVQNEIHNMTRNYSWKNKIKPLESLYCWFCLCNLSSGDGASSFCVCVCVFAGFKFTMQSIGIY